jgi:hypothetical protein
MHPLLDVRLMALRALIGPNNLGRIAHRRPIGRLRTRCRECSKVNGNDGARAKADLAQRRKDAKKKLIASVPPSHLRPTFHSDVFLGAFAPLRETKSSI